ncbi:hypothetical protein D3C76_1494190 [compost metagenome]
MEEKMLQMEAQAEASNELNAKGKSLDEEFEGLNKDAAVEAELAELMKQYEDKK